MTKVQAELDETKIILHNTVESLLERGEKLDDLVSKSEVLGIQSKAFYKTAWKQNLCQYSISALPPIEDVNIRSHVYTTHTERNHIPLGLVQHKLSVLGHLVVLAEVRGHGVAQSNDHCSSMAAAAEECTFQLVPAGRLHKLFIERQALHSTKQKFYISYIAPFTGLKLVSRKLYIFGENLTSKSGPSVQNCYGPARSVDKANPTRAAQVTVPRMGYQAKGNCHIPGIHIIQDSPKTLFSFWDWCQINCAKLHPINWQTAHPSVTQQVIRTPPGLRPLLAEKLRGRTGPFLKQAALGQVTSRSAPCVRPKTCRTFCTTRSNLETPDGQRDSSRGRGWQSPQPLTLRVCAVGDDLQQRYPHHDPQGQHSQDTSRAESHCSEVGRGGLVGSRRGGGCAG
eukprot:bmy_07924T0